MTYILFPCSTNGKEEAIEVEEENLDAEVNYCLKEITRKAPFPFISVSGDVCVPFMLKTMQVATTNPWK